MGPSDPELIGRCLAGDRKAWESLILRYQRLVFSVPLKMRMSREDAEDVFQDTFSTLFTKLGTLKDRTRLGPWLVVTAQRRALARLTRGSAAREVELETTYEAKDTRNLQLDELVRLEHQSAVEEAFQTLSGRCRKLLEALYYEDPRPSYRVIARRLGLPEGSLGPTRMRCLDKLKKALAGYLGT